MADDFISVSLERFNEITKKPEKILSSPDELIKNVKEVLKQNYDFTKNQETEKLSDTLPELITQNFELEQIWQQIELQNNELLSEYVNSVSRLLAFKDKLWFLNTEETTKENSDHSDPGDEENEENLGGDSDKDDFDEQIDDEEKSDELSGEENSDEDAEKETITREKKFKPSVVDDEFFKLREMEEFLINEEKEKRGKKENDSEDDNESVDLFEDLSSAEESDDRDRDMSLKEYNPRYRDFFGKARDERKKSARRVDNDDGSEDDVDEGDDIEDAENAEDEKEDAENAEDEIEDEGKDARAEEAGTEVAEPRSSLELREERLKKKIESIEAKALREKSWQLKGEITGNKRPENSLLQEIVEFDMTTRPAPVITQETTFILEDVIRQRIKDKAWDSVVRKVKPTEDPVEYRKKLVLDQEKSKQSLAQIYEDEFVKQREALEPGAADKPAEEPKEHKEIRALLRGLFTQLDALSNFHFTPRLVAPELRVVSNLPAISMEEVAPVAVSDAALLAPEEVKRKPRGDEIGESERTKTDKLRARRKKKLKQRQHAADQQRKDQAAKKLKPELAGRRSKAETQRLLDKVSKDRNVDKMDESLGSKATKSSTAFFSQLQDEVKGYIKAKTNAKTKNKRPADNPLHVAKRLKL